MIGTINVFMLLGNFALLLLGLLALKNSYTPNILVNYIHRKIILFYIGLDLICVFIVRSLYMLTIVDITQVSLVNGVMALACISLISIEFKRIKK